MTTKSLNDDDLDEEHPLWCVNLQIKELLTGWGASEDHDAIIAFLLSTGLPEGTVLRMHKALLGAEEKEFKHEAVRNRLCEHDGCSRWGVKDAVVLKR